MADRSVIPSRMVVEGRPLIINLIENPTIDDVVITEARIYAASLDNSDPTINDRKVSRNILDFLIRQNVER